MYSRSPRSAWGSRSQREGAAMSRWGRTSSSAQSSSTQQPSVPAQQGPPETRERPAEAERMAEGQRAQVEAEATPEVRGPLAGDPLALALPAFIVGSVALGMVLV